MNACLTNRILIYLTAISIVLLLGIGPAHALCSNPAKAIGSLEYFPAVPGYKFCDGTNWQDIDTSPTTPLGYTATGKQFTAKKISVGGETICYIKSDDKLECMGSYGGGYSLGSVTIPFRNTGIEVTGGGSWKTISTTMYGSCAIKSDDTLHCWGSNFGGSVGDNSTSPRATPTAVSGGGTWLMASAGTSFACGIKSDNKLYCWGDNNLGRTGQNTSTGNTLVPTEVSGGGSWKYVDAGSSTACGIKSDDTLHCWGWNSVGQVGNNSTSNVLVPTQVTGGGTWLMVDAGNNHSCGIKTDNSAWCWGVNGFGEIGDNTDDQRLVPTAVVDGGVSWKHIATDVYLTCAIKSSDDTMWCWGNGSYFGNGTNQGMGNFVPVSAGGGAAWKTVSATGNAVCGIKTDDTPWCWGTDTMGQFGLDQGIRYSLPYYGPQRPLSSAGHPILALGGGGGGSISSSPPPGDGGRAVSTVAVTPADELHVIVGAQGIPGYGGFPFAGFRSVYGGTDGVLEHGTSNGFGSTGNSVYGGTGAGGCDDNFSCSDSGQSTYGGRGEIGEGAMDALDGNGIGGTVTAGGSATANGRVVITPSGGGCSASATTYASPGEFIYTVPANCTSVQITADGARGGEGSGTETGGGGGASWVEPYDGDGVTASSCDQESAMTYDTALGAFKICVGNVWNEMTCAVTPCETEGTCTRAGSMGMVNNKMAFCNGSNYKVLAPMPCDDPAAFSFTTLSNQNGGATVTSNIVQITGITCAADVSITGSATNPEYRTCSNSDCSTVVQNWTSSPGTISNNNYLQLRLTTFPEAGAGRNAIVTVGLDSATWTVTNASNWKVVFVTSTEYSGSMSGVAGANTHCTTRKSAAGFTGSYKAWVSSTTSDDPESSYVTTTNDYRLPNGTTVANGWTDMTDGTLDNAINVYETGATASGNTAVWTNTATNGARTGTSHCSSWASTSGSGAMGLRTSATSTWTANGTQTCVTNARLYCIQQ